jgi:DNA-binding transcriptional LysR family regulator
MSRDLERISIGVSGRMVCGNPEFATLFALEGMGIAPFITRAFEDEIERGRLVRVLPEWQFEPLAISAIMPTKLVPAKTRLFLDFFAEKMKAVKHRIG